MIESPLRLERIGKKRKPYDINHFSPRLNLSYYPENSQHSEHSLHTYHYTPTFHYPTKKLKTDYSQSLKLPVTPKPSTNGLQSTHPIPMDCDHLNPPDQDLNTLFSLAQAKLSNGWLDLEKYSLRLKDQTTEQYLKDRQAVFPLYYLRRLEFQAMERILKGVYILYDSRYSKTTQMELD